MHSTSFFIVAIIAIVAQAYLLFARLLNWPTGECRRLEQDFARDVANSKAISYGQWRHRSWLQRLDETMAMVFERQE